MCACVCVRAGVCVLCDDEAHDPAASLYCHSVHSSHPVSGTSRGRMRRVRAHRSIATTAASTVQYVRHGRATQRRPLGTQQGTLPDVGPESRSASASSRRSDTVANDHRGWKRCRSRGNRSRLHSSKGGAIRAGAVVHDASNVEGFTCQGRCRGFFCDTKYTFRCSISNSSAAILGF